MTNTIIPIPSSPISSTSYHQQAAQPTAQLAASVVQQQQNQNNLQPPTQTVNPADKAESSDIQLQKDSESQQAEQLAAIKDWLKNAMPQGDARSTLFVQQGSTYVLTTRPDTGELYSYKLSDELNPFLNNGVQA